MANYIQNAGGSMKNLTSNFSKQKMAPVYSFQNNVAVIIASPEVDLFIPDHVSFL